MRLSETQLKLLAETLSNIGIVFFASVFIGPLLGGSPRWILSFLGLALSAFCWMLSLSVIKEKNNYEQ